MFKAIGIVFDGQKQYQIAIVCPFCAEVHIHGETWGGRVSHCAGIDTPGYDIVPPPSEEIDKAIRCKISKELKKKGYDPKKPEKMPDWSVHE